MPVQQLLVKFFLFLLTSAQHVAVLIARSAPMFNEFYGGYNRPIGLEEENKNVISRWAHHTRLPLC
jgi:hypothetical protein